MPSISVPTAVLAGGALSGASSLASGLIGSSAATSAAKTQAAAARNASALQAAIYQNNQGLLQPFINVGQSALYSLQGALNLTPGGSRPDGLPYNPTTSQLAAPFQPTMAQLESTPGYQFTLQQGERATQNAYAAQGLGSSGAALKGAANYAEGLAGTTYQQQFQNYLDQNRQIFNMLSGLAGTGLSAGGALAGVGLQTGSQIGNTLTSGAAAQAAGQVGSANALTSALSGLTGSAGNTALMLALNNAGMFGTSGGGGGYGNGDFGGGQA